MIAVNTRFRQRRVTGVERFAGEVLSRLDQDVRQIGPRRTIGQVSGHLWEQFVLPGLLRPGEVLFSPANSGPWVVRCQGLAIFDASPFDHPEWFQPAFAAWSRLSWRILSRRVSLVITPSEFSRDRLQACLGLENGRIRVIPGGVGAPFRPVPDSSIKASREKYGLPDPYMLFVGTHEPRKNLKRLFEAWELVLAEDSSCSLVITGTAGHVFRGKGYRNVPDCTLMLGFVPDADLPALYAGARAAILPSLYEGFGFPALEAMACGTPLIASNRTSLPEVVGEAALLVDPLSAADISRAILTMLADRNFRERLVSKGFERVAEFSWEKTAAGVQAALGMVGGK